MRMVLQSRGFQWLPRRRSRYPLCQYWVLARMRIGLQGTAGGERWDKGGAARARLLARDTTVAGREEDRDTTGT